MKSLSILAALALLLATEMFGQEQRVAVLTIDSTGNRNGVYQFDVYARRTNPTFPIFVGISSFYFDFNATALSSPTLSQVNPRYSGRADNIGDYGPITVSIVNGKIAVTINFLGNLTGAGQSLSPTTSERLFRVHMNVLNPQALANLKWDTVNTAITTTNSQPVQHVFLGGDNGQLPVQLASFTGTRLNVSSVLLNWRTISEVNNYGFSAERRMNGVAEWTSIPNSFVAGNGTTNEPHDYSFTDNPAQQGNLQYRLKQVDLDGTVHFTEPISISSPTSVKEFAPKEFALKQNYPNPFNPSTTIKFSVEQTGRATLEVFNLLGQRVATLFDDMVEAGYYETVTFSRGDLASGMYLYRLQSGQKSDLKRFVLVK